MATTQASEHEPSLDDGGGRPPRPLGLTAFRRLWYASGVAWGGQMMDRTALAWLAIEAGAGPLAVGLVFVARGLPALFFGLAAGTLADRVDRRKLLLLVAATLGVWMVFIGWLAGTGSMQVWQVILAAFVSGCIQVCDTPARQALVIDTTSRSAAANALALNGLASRGCGAIGAFGAGALIPFIGIGHCYYVIAFVYIIGGLLVLAMGTQQSAHVTVAHAPFTQALRGAVRLMVDIPAVRMLMFSGVAAEIFAFSYNSALPVFTKDVLFSGPGALGVLNGAGSVGSTIALMLMLIIGDRLRREPLLATIFFGYAVSLIVLALTRNLYLAAAVLVVTGICSGAFDLLQQTLIQLAVPDEQRGRAVGIWVLGLGSAPAGSLEVGALMGALGAPIALAINGVISIICAAALVVRAPHYRWRAREAAAPE
jgi:MFS family permease